MQYLRRLDDAEVQGALRAAFLDEHKTVRIRAHNKSAQVSHVLVRQDATGEFYGIDPESRWRFVECLVSDKQRAGSYLRLLFIGERVTRL